MSAIAIAGDTSGSVTLAAPAVAGTTTITLAAQTGTLNVAGPSFSVYRSTNQSLSATTYTKIQFDTEEWDTASCFDNTTNYRFTPNVAGYYQINATWQTTAIGASGQVFILVYKNGTLYKEGNYAGVSSGSAFGAVASVLVYCNGTSDYIEIYAYQGNAANIAGGSSKSYANGFLARTA